MTWNTTTKIRDQVADSEILTPSGQQIFVGPANEVLIYAEGYDNFTHLGKNTDGNWNSTAKLVS